MKTIDVIVDGGKASAGPPLAPALAPLGVNIGQVVAKINEETKGFSGMKVPVKVIVKTDKSFEIEVGAPPTGEIVKKEAGIQKGAGNREAPAGNIPLEKIIEISRKKNNSMSSELKATVKEVLGSCLSMGITIDGKNAREIIKEIDEGKHESIFKG